MYCGYSLGQAGIHLLSLFHGEPELEASLPESPHRCNPVDVHREFLTTVQSKHSQKRCCPPFSINTWNWTTITTPYLNHIKELLSQLHVTYCLCTINSWTKAEVSQAALHCALYTSPVTSWRQGPVTGRGTKQMHLNLFQFVDTWKCSSGDVNIFSYVIMCIECHVDCKKALFFFNELLTIAQDSQRLEDHTSNNTGLEWRLPVSVNLVKDGLFVWG